MKAVIWICSILICSVAITLLKYAGITLGSLETLLIYVLLVSFPTKKLCDAWDKCKASKSNISIESASSESSIPDSCPDAVSETDFSDSPLLSRLARSAEKRLNATEAEMRFASDIAADIYTADMIPPSMDTKKVLELSDYYAAERLNIINLSPSDTFRTSSLSKQPEAPDTTPSPKPRRQSLYYYFLRLKPWIPAIVILSLFVIICIYYSLDLQRISSSTPAKSAQTDTSTPATHAVDYKTGYVGSINSDFIHRNTCRHADNIQEENRVYYKSVADAVVDGRSKCSVCLSDTSSTAPSESGSLVPITPPGNGEIIKDTQKEKLAPLTVKTSGSSDYYIALHCVGSSNTSTSGKGTLVKLSSYDMTFYVEGGKTVEILVPLAEYEVYYAVGDTWYGNVQKFGSDTRYYQCEDTFLFEEQWDDEGMYYSGWTLTLYAVPNGNMDSEEISVSEFPA